MQHLFQTNFPLSSEKSPWNSGQFLTIVKKQYDIQERSCSYRSFHSTQVEYACVKINFFSPLTTMFRSKLKTKSLLFHCSPLEVRIAWMVGKYIVIYL